MSPQEIAAFNLGIALVADLAARSAAAMREREVNAPTRFNFAIEMAQAIADEATGLMINDTARRH